MSEIKISTYNTRGLRKNTKRRKVFAFLHKQNRDIILIQETHATKKDETYWGNEWGGTIIFSHGSALSRGVCILFNPKLTFNITKSLICKDGRYIILDVWSSQRSFTLVCLYGPNIDDPSFYANITSKLFDFDCKDIIIGGDFNLVLNIAEDKKGGNPRTNFNAREKCLDLMNTYDLIDIWRQRNPKQNNFTWTSNITNNIHCRLDFFLISRNLLHLTTNTNIAPSINSDHSIVHLNFKITNEPKGPGFWKFNTSLLKDHEYNELICNIISNESETYVNVNSALKWELIKQSIRSASMNFSKQTAKKRRQKESVLLKKITTLEKHYYISHSPILFQELKQARNELDLIYDFKLHGIIIRSRARWVEQGEKNTAYFLNLEKRNKTNNTIFKLLDNNGCIVDSHNSILQVLNQFYSDLYTSEGCDPNLCLGNINNHLKLSDEQAQICDGYLTNDECKTAIFSLSSGKSPGSDGLSTDFYKHFWPSIGDLVTDSLNYGLDNLTLSAEQGRGILTLIPKPKKDPLFIKNYRPISLLNTDYKICSKSLATRLKLVIPSIIGKNQTGFIKGRFIGENIRFALDLIDFCKEHNHPAMLILVDFEKAFDRLEWDFIFKSLMYFNFNQYFIHWIRTLYSNSTTCVHNNGFSSAYFPISRGVRQGCPISPYLFIICAEILAIQINNTPLIRGITIQNEEIKIMQYADDMLIVSDGTYSSLKKIDDLLKDYKTASGLKINYDKTNIFPLGPLEFNKPLFMDVFKYNWTLGPVTLLGITFDNGRDSLFHLNYTPKLSRLKGLLNLWSRRDLTPIGKITIVKSFAISQLVYLFQVLPNPPDSFIKQIERIIFNFIWSGKPDKVKRSTLIATIPNGGLNALHISSFINSLKCTWVKRYITDNTGSWKLFFDYHLKHYGKSLIFQCNYLGQDVQINNNFIRDVCSAWAIYNYVVCKENFGNEIIWNNSNIKINNNTIFHRQLYVKGVMYLGDLLDDGNTFLAYNQFMLKYDLQNFPFTSYFGIISAVPVHWKRSMGYTQNIKNNFVENICNTPFLSRVIYKHTVNKITLPPTSVGKWDKQFSTLGDRWTIIFQTPFKSVSESKIQYFQYRFLNRILATNKYLHTINIKDSPLCTFCETHIETIEHLFWECGITSRFILDVEQLILKQQFTFSKQDIFFGYKLLLKHPYNLLIYHLKYYIFNKKLDNKIPDKTEFLFKFKFVLSVEKECKHPKISYEILRTTFSNLLF